MIAACVLRLVEQGYINLDDLVKEKPYTLRHLLQHRAGVADYGGLRAYHNSVSRGEQPWPIEELFLRLNVETLLFKPGQKFMYSNIGYCYVRQLMENISGEPFHQCLRRLVFNPLHLKSARVVDTREDMKLSAFETDHDYHPGWVYHGLVMGSVADAALGLHGLLEGKLLRTPLLNEMLQCYPVGGEIPGRPWATTGYGLGLMIGQIGMDGMPQPTRAIGHSAAGPGSVGAVYHFPDISSKKTVAVFGPFGNEGITEAAALQMAIEM
ncbi:MAG: serine hydrolase [Nitrospirales bacterium]|nr:MAG: serine hydrolase [Nitrospirales bacterium]